MFKVVLLVIGCIVLNGSELDDLVKQLDYNRLLKSKNYEIEGSKSQLKVIQGSNLPKLDFTLRYIHLQQTPQIAINLPNTPKIWADAGTKENYEADITLKYPIFRGFAISNMIKQSKIKSEIVKLQKSDLKRNLTLNLVKLYGNLYSLNKSKTALMEAKKALNSSYKKAQGFYQVELIPKSELLNIKANLYKIKADIVQINQNINILTNNIKYLTSIKADAISLPTVVVQHNNIENRTDIQILKKLLFIDKLDIKLAKSSLFPQINLIASYKKVGDSLSLDGNGYKNANESYGGIELKYNLFDGFSNNSNIQSAKAKLLARQSFVEDYIIKAKIDIQNELLKLNSLQENLKWAKEELKASNEYLYLSMGRFNQQLISSDELNLAIANNAKIKAKIEQIKSEIFIQKEVINLKQQ